jgi:hypothetical protein
LSLFFITTYRIALEKYSNDEYPEVYPWIVIHELKPKKKKKD